MVQYLLYGEEGCPGRAVCLADIVRQLHVVHELPAPHDKYLDVQSLEQDRIDMCQLHDQKEQSLKLQLVCAKEHAEKAMHHIQEQHAKQVRFTS